MPLSSIVTVVLRLFSFFWLIEGVAMFASAAATVAPPAYTNYWAYLPALVMVCAAAVIFIFSTPLARLATPPPNPSISLGSLSPFDLYCFAFTFLGLYFVLSSLANTLNWAHYFVILARRTPEQDPPRETSFDQLTAPRITLVAGGASLLFAPRCARKLMQLQAKHEITRP
jgi:hypothetical protein